MPPIVIVRQEVIASDFSNNRCPLFWVWKSAASNAEVDLLVQHEGVIIPVEVIAGEIGTLRSLHQFIEHSNHPYAFRLYGGPVDIVEAQTPSGRTYTLLNLPYFLAKKLKEYVAWFVEGQLETKRFFNII